MCYNELMLKSYNKAFLYLPTLMFSIAVLSGLVLSGSFVSADDSAVSNIAITVPASCTLSGTGQNSHNADLNNGTYTADIGTTTLKAYCNDSEGFALYAIGYTGEEYGVTNLVGANTNATIATGTATTAGDPDISNWAMKLGTVTSPTPTYPITIDNGFSSYSQVPSTYTKVAHRDSGTDTGTNAEGSTLTTTYAAYISKTQTADTYNGKVKYTMVHPANETPLQPQTATSGCINYFPNGSNVVGTMGCQSISDLATIATLLASNFSREGYGFAGWNDKFDYTGNFYGPNEDITFTAGQYTDNGLALYAVWVPSVGSLQDSTIVSTLCGAGTGSLIAAPTDGIASLRSVSALTDQRDNQDYAIAKLADGNCWMIENLRLEAENTRSATNQALSQGYNMSTIYGDFEGLADAETSNFASLSTDANSLYYSGTQSGTASIDIGTTNNPDSRIPRYNDSNTQNRAINPTNKNEKMYSYGNHYNWSAANATTGYYEQATTTTSICPSGWILPYRGDTSGGFQYLIAKMIAEDYGISAERREKMIRKFPYNYIRAGYYAGPGFNSVGNEGRYWTSDSSSSNNNKSAYSLIFNQNGEIKIQGSAFRYEGQSVRCVTTD